VPGKIPRAVWLVLVLAYFLYFYHLAAVGMIGPDEPRYASIARQMAVSGDWITPRLNGSPWFEKPALLYWMEAAAFRAGLGPEMAPRFPVALAAFGFLFFYWWILEREFGRLTAWLATLMLGSSAAWIVCSQIGVPDLPLTVTYSAAMLLALPWVAKRDARLLPAAAIFLGLAVLAKGPVALILAAPVLLPKQRGEGGGRGWGARQLLAPRVLLPFLIVALPWYILCAFYNGRAFLVDFLWKHNFERFTSAAALQHGQPFWYYVPVFLGVLLPWTPLIPLAVRRGFYADSRRLFLLSWLVLVIVFFSASANKLPGYILPLTPAAAALLGLALSEARDAAPWLAVCALLLVAFPIAAPMLPTAVASGLLRSPWPEFQWFWLLPLAVAAAAWVLERRTLRLAAVLCIVTGAVVGTAWLKETAAPSLDRATSSRALWPEISSRAGTVCIDWMPRGLQYSLDYYSVTPLPDCATHSRPLWLTQLAGQAPKLTPPH
jgi:4-amino-4-deoxy-L-arabinose transferase-like glycosyltransferase